MALRNMEEELTVIQSAVTHKVIYFAESKLNERVIKESENILEIQQIKWNSGNVSNDIVQYIIKESRLIFINRHTGKSRPRLFTHTNRKEPKGKIA